MWTMLLGEAETAGTVRLSQSEMARIVGGHGGASCDSCTFDGLSGAECAHFSSSDACRGDQCIENVLTEDTCELYPVSNCWSQLNSQLNSCVQYLRVDTNCTTNNPYLWKLWRVHYYGSGCSKTNFYIRCEKPTNNCNGTLINDTEHGPGIECI